MESSHIIVLVLSGTMLFGACSDHGSEIVPTNQNGQPFVLTVEPNSGRIGSIVAIGGERFKVPTTQYMVGFAGADDRLVADSCSDSTIFTFVPFGARSGPLSVFSDQLLGRTDKFSVTEVVDTTALTAVRYDISPMLTANDSSVIDRMGFRRTWRANRQGDTIQIIRGFSTGDEYYEYHIVLISQRAIQLPRPVALWTYIKPDYPGAWTDTVRVGILKIQEFDTSGVISGRFFGKPSISKILSGTFAFWVDLKR